MTKNLSASAIFKRLDNARTTAENWTGAELKTSTERLHAQLSDCLSIVEELRASDLATRRSFNTRYIARGLTCRDTTPIATKVIRYVFMADNKRVSAYSKVLCIALEHKITSETLVAWIDENEGIENIRRTRKNGLTPKALNDQLIKLADQELSDATPLVPAFGAHDDLQPHKDGDTHYAVAIVRKLNQGQLEIAYGLNDRSLVKTAMILVGKQVQKKKLVEMAESANVASTKARAVALTSISENQK